MKLKIRSVLYWWPLAALAFYLVFPFTHSEKEGFERLAYFCAALYGAYWLITTVAYGVTKAIKKAWRDK